MITQQQFYVYYTDYTIVIDGMKGKLDEAKKKNPNADYRAPEKTIKTLEFLRQVFHTMYHDQQTIDNASGKIMEERHRLITRCIKLEKENEQLKTNIKL